MSFQSLDILRRWLTGTTVKESCWDDIRTPLLDWAESCENDINQLRIDILGSTYSLDNDGLANLANPIRQWDSGVSALSWVFSGTVSFSGSVTYTGNLAWYSGTAFLGTLDHANTAARVYTFQDATDTVVMRNTTDTLTNKTLTSPDLTTPHIRGAGAGDAILQYVNSGTDRTYTIPDTGANTGVLVDEHFPIGSFLHWSDYNATLAFPNTTIWHCCDGQAIVDVLSPLNGITPLDMTGRYFVGFTTGVEGDGSIDLAGNTNAAAVGNALHQVNLQHAHSHTHGALGVTASGGQSADHTHTGPSHTHTTPNHAHTLSAHTHTGPSHSHPTAGAHYHDVAAFVAHGGGVLMAATTDPGHYPGADGTHAHGTSGTGATGAPSVDQTNSSGASTTGADGTGTTGGVSAGHTHDINHTHAADATNGGSTTQTIQPRSVQCRVFVRKR